MNLQINYSIFRGDIMNKDINLIELKEAIGEEGIKDLLRYIQEAIKKGIDERIDKLHSIDIEEYL